MKKRFGCIILAISIFLGCFSNVKFDVEAGTNRSDIVTMDDIIFQDDFSEWSFRLLDIFYYFVSQTMAGTKGDYQQLFENLVYDLQISGIGYVESNVDVAEDGTMTVTPDFANYILDHIKEYCSTDSGYDIYTTIPFNKVQPHMFVSVEMSTKFQSFMNGNDVEYLGAIQSTYTNIMRICEMSEDGTIAVDDNGNYIDCIVYGGKKDENATIGSVYTNTIASTGDNSYPIFLVLDDIHLFNINSDNDRSSKYMHPSSNNTWQSNFSKMYTSVYNRYGQVGFGKTCDYPRVVWWNGNDWRLDFLVPKNGNTIPYALMNLADRDYNRTMYSAYTIWMPYTSSDKSLNWKREVSIASRNGTGYMVWHDIDKLKAALVGNGTYLVRSDEYTTNDNLTVPIDFDFDSKLTELLDLINDMLEDGLINLGMAKIEHSLGNIEDEMENVNDNLTTLNYSIQECVTLLASIWNTEIDIREILKDIRDNSGSSGGSTDMTATNGFLSKLLTAVTTLKEDVNHNFHEVIRYLQLIVTGVDPDAPAEPEEPEEPEEPTFIDKIGKLFGEILAGLLTLIAKLIDLLFSGLLWILTKLSSLIGSVFGLINDIVDTAGTYNNDTVLFLQSAISVFPAEVVFFIGFVLMITIVSAVLKRVLS